MSTQLEHTDTQSLVEVLEQAGFETSNHDDMVVISGKDGVIGVHVSRFAWWSRRYAEDGDLYEIEQAIRYAMADPEAAKELEREMV